MLDQDQTLTLRVDAELNGLQPGDVLVECLIGHEIGGRFRASRTVTLTPARDGSTAFVTDLKPLPGLQKLRLRMRPVHAAMSHPFELGAAVWA